jgi:hypothetical protein
MGDGDSKGISIRKQPGRPLAEAVQAEEQGSRNLSARRRNRIARKTRQHGPGIRVAGEFT